jgi:tRNA pseudouridine65 synthase
MLPILYRDDHLVAINKPPGLLVHRTGLDAGETRFAVQLLRDQIGQPVWPAHRLDKGTSGVLLFALDADTASTLGKAFESGDGIQKTYQAMVRGWPADEGLIDHPLKRMTDDTRDTRDTLQSAQTRYQTLERFELPLAFGVFDTLRVARVELQPLTGRRHQLRRHMKHISHPIIGDSSHGKGPLNRAVAEFLVMQRMWLHAGVLELRHPLTHEPFRVEASLGGEWSAWRGDQPSGQDICRQSQDSQHSSRVEHGHGLTENGNGVQAGSMATLSA